MGRDNPIDSCVLLGFVYPVVFGQIKEDGTVENALAPEMMDSQATTSAANRTAYDAIVDTLRSAVGSYRCGGRKGLCQQMCVIGVLLERDACNKLMERMLTTATKRLQFV